MDRVFGSGRPSAIQHEERADLSARCRRPRGTVAQARQRLRWGHVHRLLVEGRQHHLLQWGDPGDEPAHGFGRAERQRAPDYQRKGIALCQPRPGQRRPPHQLLRWHDTDHVIHAAGHRPDHQSGIMDPAHRRQPPGARFPARRAGRDCLEVEGRPDGRRRARQAGRLSVRPALPADRRDSWRTGIGRRAQLQRRLRISGVCRSRLCRAAAELSRIHQLWRSAQERHRGQLLSAGI